MYHAHWIHVREYRSWAGMLNRCRNPNAKGYENYGGRGITVCPVWLSFTQFFADMGKRPTPRHSLDRVNNMLGYSKENCRWATHKEQARNKRSTRLTMQDAVDIRAAHAAGVPRTELVRTYASSRSNIGSVLSGRTWAALVLSPHNKQELT